MWNRHEPQCQARLPGPLGLYLPGSISTSVAVGTCLRSNLFSLSLEPPNAGQAAGCASAVGPLCAAAVPVTLACSGMAPCMVLAGLLHSHDAT